MNQIHILVEYDKYVQRYKSLYGTDKTIVLIQLGSFYEMCYNENDKKGESNLRYICDEILQIIPGEKSYKDHSTNESKKYLMGGFPMIAQEKYLTYLLSHNYTIVIVDQVTEPPNPERKVTKILSPGTDILYNKRNSNNLLSIYIEGYQYEKSILIQVGISAIDLSTGDNYIHSIVNTNRDNQYCMDEISRFIHFYNPSELLFHTKNFELSRNDVISNWDINHDCFRINHFTDSIYTKPTFINNEFKKIYGFSSMLHPISELNLDHKPETMVSLLYLLLYIKHHKSELLKNISKPIEKCDTNYLTLTSNSIRQLNIVNNYSYFKGQNESLLSVCNLCVTPMGKRELQTRLLYPLVNKEEIESRYDKIEYYRDKYENIRLYLTNIIDIDKSLRLLSLTDIEPNKLKSTYISYKLCAQIFTTIDYKNDSFVEFMKEMESMFQFDMITNEPLEQMKRSIFNYGEFDKIDIIDKEIVIYTERMNIALDILSSFTESLKIGVVGKDKNEYVFYCTNNRAEVFREKINKKKKIEIKTNNEILYTFLPEQISYKKRDKQNTSIHIPFMEIISNELTLLYKRLSRFNREIYNDVIVSLYETYSNTLYEVNTLTSDIDVACCSVKLSIDNNYYRPEIVDSDKSSLDIKELRHPIVEQLHKEYEYVTNDITLGINHDGILLYGTNACGKSTLMKAIGLNLVMAQAGFYVACRKFIYTPYTQIFTRILNNDNIFKAQSSFAVEMSELRTILNKCDKHSLILGDELCSGTETTSAISIVYAGLKTLSDIQCSYLFTSHLHQLTTLDKITSIQNMKIYHLEIKYDGDILIYDRKLREGAGPPIYGIKVCEALGLSSEFIEMAKTIQKELEDTNIKTSPYNKKILVDKCEVCGERAKETHHIKEQCTANENGMIDHHHKNNEHNLVPLCKQCHQQTTYGTLIIEGYIQTSQGKQLKYHNVTSSKTRKKYDELQIKTIKTYKSEYDINIKNCISLLLIQENINIGRSTLKKIMENKY